MQVTAYTFVLFLVSFFVGRAASLGATDTITWGGDNSRTGYQTNHNMDPTIVGSSQFGQIFQSLLPGIYNGASEQIFSQPLVYTLSDGIQYLFVATTQNNLYKLNAATGAIVARRNLHIPFLVADLDGCTDINPLVGVTATGVIDPSTDTLYLTAKTYQDQTAGPIPQGRPNGRYYFHAINVNDLSERPGFPVNLEGTVARNNPIRSFNGGIHHQRPALLLTGQYVYAGFASHCVKWNYTGWIMGWDKTTGAIVERYAMEGAPVDSQTQGGGVWMSGGGLSSDDAGSMFYATGNGHASQLSTIPVNGHNPPSALEEAAVHMIINSDGTLTIVDFFMPWEKTQLDGADRDLGTSPLELLPTQFSCGDVKRIGVVTGKSGKTYWLNLDDLGGYQNGPNKLDDVIQVYQNENSVYAGAGVYPLEGGFIYINVIQYPTHVFKFNCDAGVPSFTKVADSPEVNAYLGVGHGTTTSINNEPGTGLAWVSDVNGYNLRVYNAVPVNGQLTLINHFNIPAVTKFTRPVFGNGRVYIGTTAGYIYGFGSPVNLPMNCSSPYDFATADIKTPTAVKTITCTAYIALTVTNITLTGSSDFSISSLPAVPRALAIGDTFSFQAVFSPSTTGLLSSDVVIATSNGVTGYSTTTPVTLQGNGQSVAPLLGVSPVTVAFQGVITGQQVGGVNQTANFINYGNNLLNISSIQYSETSETGPFISSNVSSAGFPQVGPFTFFGLPSTIPGGSNSPDVVTINFDTSKSGNFAAYLVVNSDGGSKTFDVVGTAGDAPVALVEFQTIDGLGWVQYETGMNFTFGNVTENQTRSLKMRVTNTAGPDSVKLSLTVSKPPFGLGGIIGANNQIDLNEGTNLGPGQNATATLYCSVPKTQWDTDSYLGTAIWTMNFNDLTFGHRDIPFVCTAVAEQAPPLLPNGNGRYRYIGCFKENNPGRQLQKQIYGNDANTNQMCIAACATGNYIFCGTQYNRECWAGPTIPNLQVDDGNCDYPCSGDINQICGGNGINGAGGAFISLFADSLQFDGNSTVPSKATSLATTGTISTAPTSVNTSSSASVSKSNITFSTSAILTPVGPTIVPSASGYTYIGCYAEPPTSRALPQLYGIDALTIGICASQCAAYIYFGAEYSRECWCGNFINPAATIAPDSDCNMVCDGSGLEFCGAGNRLSLYKRNISESAGNKVTSTSSVSVSSISISSSVSEDKAASLNMSRSSVSSVSSVSFSNSTFSTPTSSSAALATYTVSPVTSNGNINFTYYSCVSEPSSGRLLPSVVENNGTYMTIEKCLGDCWMYAYAGVEYGRECWCGNALNWVGNKGAVQGGNVSDGECNFICPGNESEFCGAGGMINLFRREVDLS